MGAMMLWIEVHVTPAEDVEGDADITAFDMDRDTALDELRGVLEKKLVEADEGDEVIATITVQSVEE